MNSLFFVFIFSFCLSIIAYPYLIKLLVLQRIVDKPDLRKVHSIEKPSIGGILFLPTTLICIWLVHLENVFESKEIYLLISCILIIAIGLLDDLVNLRARYKLLLFIPAISCAVFGAEIQLTSFQGLFWLNEINYPFAVLLTVFTIVSMTNAFNLIDGIDGLAGIIGFLACTILGVLINLQGHYFHGVLLIGVAGSILAFLRFNWMPSKIFMGDTGSLFLGFLITISLIRFIEDRHLLADTFSFQNPISFSIAIIVIPFFDTIRVFSVRIFSGKSPFDPDKNHLHHLLLKLGFNHASASFILLSVTCTFILIAVLFRGFTDNSFFYWMFLVGLSLSVFTHYLTYGKSFARKRKLVMKKSHHKVSNAKDTFPSIKPEKVPVS